MRFQRRAFPDVLDFGAVVAVSAVAIVNEAVTRTIGVLVMVARSR